MKVDKYISPLSHKSRSIKLTDYAKMHEGIIPISDPRTRSSFGIFNILSRMETGTTYRISQNVRYRGYALTNKIIQRCAKKLKEISACPIEITVYAKMLNRRKHSVCMPKRKE